MPGIKKLLRAAFSSVVNDNGAVARAANLRRALSPPHDDTREVLHGVSVSDPFRPLEKLDAPETKAWTARENKRFESFMAPAAGVVAGTIAALGKAAPAHLRETAPEWYGGGRAFWRLEDDEAHPYLFAEDGTLLLDPRDIDPSGRTRIKEVVFSPDGNTLAYRLGVDGSERGELRFMDAASGRDLGLSYPNSRSLIEWDPDSRGFHYAHFDDALKRGIVKHHRMGTRMAEDETVFMPEKPETNAVFFRSFNEKGVPNHEWIYETTPEKHQNGLRMRAGGDKGDFRVILPPGKAELQPLQEIGGKIYALTTLDAPNRKLVRIDPANPAPENWETVLPEDKSTLLTQAVMWQGRILASYSRGTERLLRVFRLEDGAPLHEAPLPQPGTFMITGFDDTDMSCTLTCNTPLGNGVYKYGVDANTLTAVKEPDGLEGCIVETIAAEAADGAKIPMTVIRQPGTQLDGSAAAMLYAYGGFGAPSEPVYNPAAAQWVRAGGIFVTAHIRGGGEYGKAWHEAGRGANKKTSFGDVAACARELAQRKYTSAPRIALQGMSNGGLVALGAMMQSPALFGAVIAEVPITDLFRLHTDAYYGDGFRPEYGDSAIRADFNAQAQTAPLHTVKQGFSHPPLLIRADADDDCVMPWHSYKMAAALQSLEDPRSLTLLQVRRGGGHGGGLTKAAWQRDVGATFGFLSRTIGPIDQKAYKAVRAKKQPKLRQG